VCLNSRTPFASASRWAMSALDQNHAIGVRAAVADHLGRAPARAELIAARRAAHSLATLGCARVLHVPGADVDADAGDRTYLVLAKPNVIMNEIRLRGLAVAGSDVAGRKSPPNHAQTVWNLRRFPPECQRWCPTNPGRGFGRQIGSRSCSLPRRCTRRASPAPAEPRSTYQARDPLSCRASGH
jgi:hypothetical protein